MAGKSLPPTLRGVATGRHQPGARSPIPGRCRESAPRRHLGARASPGPAALRDPAGPGGRGGLSSGSAGGPAAAPVRAPGVSRWGPAGGGAAAPYTCPCDSCLLSAERRAGHAGSCRPSATKLAGDGHGEDYSPQSAPRRDSGGAGQSGRWPGMIDVQRGAIRCAGESKHVRPLGGFLIDRPDSQ